jgi:hypothetical protein
MINSAPRSSQRCSSAYNARAQAAESGGMTATRPNFSRNGAPLCVTR